MHKKINSVKINKLSAQAFGTDSVFDPESFCIDHISRSNVYVLFELGKPLMHGTEELIDNHLQRHGRR